MYKFIIAIIVSMAVMASPVQAKDNKAIIDIIADCNVRAQITMDIMQERLDGVGLAELSQRIIDGNSAPEHEGKGDVEGLMSLVIAVYTILPVTKTPERVRDLTFQGCYESATK